MMRLPNSPRFVYSFTLFRPLSILLIISLSLGLPGSTVNSYSLKDDPSNQTYSTSSDYLSRTSRSVTSTPSPFSLSSFSNGTNSANLPVSFGLLVATANGTASSYCIAYYNNSITTTITIASKPEETNFYKLIKLDNYNFCSPPSSINRAQYQQTDNGSYILINFTNKCPLTEQAINVADRYPNSKGLIISLPNDVNVYNLPVQNVIDPRFIIALVGEESTSEFLMKYGDQTRVMLYSPKDDIDDERGIFDSSLMGIWFIAMATVFFGGSWSGILRYKLFLTRQLQENEACLAELQGGENDSEERRKKKENNKLDSASLDVTPTTVVLFVVYMCVVLLILYFFYSYLVFMMIIFFVVFCTISTYSSIMRLFTCVAPRMRWSKIGWRVLVTIISSIGPVTWFFIRKTDQAWLLQNILAMNFCIHVLQMLRFPNYKIISLLLSLLFVYDIFFVFLTPLFTSDGESIMVKVAMGGSSSEPSYTFGAKTIGESLPVVFQWPRSLTSSLLNEKCYQGRIFWTSKLGFGDVLVPGFLISYCQALGLFLDTPFALYFTVSCIFYGLGLILTFVALNLMNSAQPALLYLVPATLIPPLVIAWYRNDLNILWNGPEPAAIEALKQRRWIGEDRLAPNIGPNVQRETEPSNSPKESLASDQQAIDTSNPQESEGS